MNVLKKWLSEKTKEHIEELRYSRSRNDVEAEVIKNILDGAEETNEDTRAAVSNLISIGFRSASIHYLNINASRQLKSIIVLSLILAFMWCSSLFALVDVIIAHFAL